MRKSVIYCIRNIVTGKRYVGSAVRGLADRKYQHRRQLLAGKHHSILLQRAWDKYGPSAFEWIVLEVGERDTLIQLEQHWLDKLDACNPRAGYNISPTAGSNAGAAFYKSESFRQKHREKAKRMGLGLSHPPRSAIHSINQGRTQTKLSDQQIIRIRERLSLGHYQKDIAKDYGVCQQTICNIARKRGVVYGGVSRLDYKPMYKHAGA